ncbi:MAG TPA: hypothetical protein VID27_14705, partial [Blastocatellia bacterium]
IFIDSQGSTFVHDISSVKNEGSDWIHLSIRVSSEFTVMADCLTGDSSDPPTEKFLNGEALGIRFQPFYLAECKFDPKELVGAGLFTRGFHFSGVVTPGNVSLSCVCDHCRRSFRLQSFHAGFSNLVYFYCSSGPHTLTASSYLDDAPPVMGEADRDALARFEARLPQCEKCGGDFKYFNSLLCPHCSRPYIDFQNRPDEREVEYYGNLLYGDSLQEWEPQ